MDKRKTKLANASAVGVATYKGRQCRREWVRCTASWGRCVDTPPDSRPRPPNCSRAPATSAPSLAPPSPASGRAAGRAWDLAVVVGRNWNQKHISYLNNLPKQFIKKKACNVARRKCHRAQVEIYLNLFLIVLFLIPSFVLIFGWEVGLHISDKL